ncbi:N-6 DNA methylase [Streptomyces sp. LZ34]
MTDSLAFPPPVPVSNGKSSNLAVRLLDYCNVLCDRGLSTMEAVEQLSYLLMLKIEDEVLSLPSTMPRENWPASPSPYGWRSLTQRRGDELVAHFTKVLAYRSHHGTGTALDVIFAGAQNHIRDARLLDQLVFDLFEARRWTSDGTQLLSEAYEDLLARAVSDSRTGAGQFFTPRPLIDAIVEAIQPELTDTITDPACGTGGFLIGVHNYVAQHELFHATRDEWYRYNTEQIWGQELVPGTARLATANLLLHGIGCAGQPAPIAVGDALARPPRRRASLVLSHPPFGKHAAVPGEPSSTARHDTDAREDFVAKSIDKQVNFLQHVMSLTAKPGRAAVVVSDGILFARGAAETVRRYLLDQFDAHTVLRLPAGIFPNSSIRANVIFFDRPPHRTDNRPQTTRIWVYDLRSSRQFAHVHTPLVRRDLDDFVSVYLPGRPRTDRAETEHFRCFDVRDVLDHDHARLDLTWPQGPSGTDLLMPPEEIAQYVVHDLRLALQEFEELAAELHGEA